MDKIATLMEMPAPLEGLNPTNLPGTTFYMVASHSDQETFCFELLFRIVCGENAASLYSPVKLRTLVSTAKKNLMGGYVYGLNLLEILSIQFRILPYAREQQIDIMHFCLPNGI